MTKTSYLYLVTMIAILLAFGGCNGGDDDDDDTAPAEVEGDEAGECDDGVDNDQDGLTDCDDDGCENASACVGDDDDVTSDDDDDTTGDDDDTAGLCEGADVCDGDYEIENAPDLDAIQLCSEITGDLRFDNLDSWATDIDLPCLTTVWEGFYVDGNDSLTSLSMSKLETVWGRFEIQYNDAMEHLDLGSLTMVDSYVYFKDNDSISTLDGMQSLATVDEVIYITDNNCLSQEEAEAFAAAVDVGYPDESWIDGNGADYPCN